MTHSQTITKREMEILIAIQTPKGPIESVKYIDHATGKEIMLKTIVHPEYGKTASELRTVKDLTTHTAVKIDRANLYRHLASLERRGFIQRKKREIEREQQKGGPETALMWYINSDNFGLIVKELGRLKDIKPATHDDFWSEAEQANQEAEWKRQDLAREEHCRILAEEIAKLEADAVAIQKIKNLWAEGWINRTEISKAVGYTRNAVSAMIDKMMAKGEIPKDFILVPGGGYPEPGERRK